jgi:hypothetical protein
MRIQARVLYGVVLVLSLAFSADAFSQGGSVNFRIRFTGSVDCERPLPVKNVPISGDGTGTINTDGSASAEVTQTAFVFSNTVRFDGRLGAPPTAAPGGTTSQVRVSGRRSLRLIWNLPNNAMIVNVTVKGQTCSATFESRPNPGQRQHTLFDGNGFHYCDRPRVASSSCEVR